MLVAAAMPPDLMGSTEQHRDLVFPLLLLVLVFLHTTAVIPYSWVLLLGFWRQRRAEKAA